MKQKQPNMQIRFVNPKLETWFLSQMSKAETIISNALKKVETLGHFDRQSIDKAVYHASVIDLELIQLVDRQYDELSGDDQL